jgi:Ca2+-binding EF-hand superfamily protein
MKHGFTADECEEIFKNCDKDHDEKLNFQEFVSMIVPPGLKIDTKSLNTYYEII